MEEKKANILSAAESIISKKGYPEARISEIAKAAGVTESVIYQYFHGKEDLLFSIPGERMKAVLLQLNDHLQGILDPGSRLSKMIWFHLRNNDAHPDYARILLLDCRSSKSFYRSDAYQLIRQYAGILSGILNDGIQTGVFRSDIDLKLMRDIILGTLDMETISSLGIGEIDECVSYLEDIMSLVNAMLSPKKPAMLSKSDLILRAAEKIFAERGFNGARVSAIAKAAGVAEGTVYEYFQNKEDLFFAIPQKYFDSYLEEQKETFQIKSPHRKLKRLINFHFSLFLGNLSFLKIFLFEVQLNRKFYVSNSFQSFLSYFSIIEDVVQEGIAEGTFRKDVSSRLFRNMLLGTFSHLALRWYVVDTQRKYEKMEEVSKVTELLCDAVMADSPRFR